MWFLDRYAPIGDQSRCSYSWLFDYYKNLVHAAETLNPGGDAAARGTWWMQHILMRRCGDSSSVNHLTSAFNYRDDLLPYAAVALAPTDTTYHAGGAGVFFARSGWDANASWLAVVAGKYDWKEGVIATKQAADRPPTEWQVVRVDLWTLAKRPLRIQAIGLAASGGGAVFDQILLGRSEADLDRVGQRIRQQ